MRPDRHHVFYTTLLFPSCYLTNYTDQVSLKPSAILLVNPTTSEQWTWSGRNEVWAWATYQGDRIVRSVTTSSGSADSLATWLAPSSAVKLGGREVGSFCPPLNPLARVICHGDKSVYKGQVCPPCLIAGPLCHQSHSRADKVPYRAGIWGYECPRFLPHLIYI